MFCIATSALAVGDLSLVFGTDDDVAVALDQNLGSPFLDKLCGIADGDAFEIE